MSFILDALRRADAERQRGAVPGLHAQPTVAPLAEPASALRLGRAGLAAAALAVLAAAAALVWWWPSAPPAAATAGAAAVPQTIAQAAAPPALPRTVPDAAAPGSPAAPAVAGPPQAAVPSPAAQAGQLPRSGRQAPAVQAAVPSAPGLRVPVSRPQPVRPPVPPALGPAPEAAVPPADPSASALPARLPRLADLPEASRRELSALSLGGSVYADQPSVRMVIVNGQVFHEGERPLPELQVLRIGLKSVVFGFRGQRFEMPL
jgi:general secretion pathway protein B